MAILSISSQVSQGHVGNSATAFALRRLGQEVWDVPTIVLSHHPGHGAPAGMRVPPEKVAELIASVLSRGRPDFVFSGYLADAANAELVAGQVATLREAGTLPYVLDPVLGDTHTGLYVSPEIAEAVRSLLLPAATIVLPNRFELEHLSGQGIEKAADCSSAARRLIEVGPRAVVCTSSPADSGMVAVQVVTADQSWRVQMPAIPNAPHGTGDLFAGVFMAKWLEGAPLQEAGGYAAGAVHAVVAWSRAMAKDDLALVEAQASLSDPPVLPKIEVL